MGYSHDNAPRCIGNFVHAETGAFFEYGDVNNGGPFSGYDISIGASHIVYVGPWSKPWEGIERGTRAAIVKKTVAYIAVDEDEYGRPVWEKWPIKKHNVYPARA